jgi:hypothetical protein
MSLDSFVWDSFVPLFLAHPFPSSLLLSLPPSSPQHRLAGSLVRPLSVPLTTYIALNFISLTRKLPTDW